MIFAVFDGPFSVELVFLYFSKWICLRLMIVLPS